MAQSKVARRVSRNHARYRGRHDINVVPMIDMMIILVFFLIFTAVFTKTNILELNLPGADSAVPDLPEGLNLEVIVRKDKHRGRRSRHRPVEEPALAAGRVRSQGPVRITCSW